MLGTLDFCHITELPWLDTEFESDALPLRYVAPLIGAYSESETVAVAWIRQDAYAPLTLCVGGDKSIGRQAQVDNSTTTSRFLYPVGASGRKHTLTMNMLQSFPTWTRCSIMLSIDPDDQQKHPDQKSTATLFEDVTDLLLGVPFAWLVVGVPVVQSKDSQEYKRLERRIRMLTENRESSPQDRIDVERYERRLREQAHGRWKGWWDVHVLVGADGENAARRVAAMLCAATETSGTAYALVPGSVCSTLEATLQSTRTPGDSEDMLSLGVPSEMLARIARFPRREVPGVRLVKPHTFDVTPEQTGDLMLGKVVDASLSEVGPFGVPFATLNRHTFVCGATGSGKSQTVRAMLEGLSIYRDQGNHKDSGIPWLVIEPAKAEYARMSGRLGNKAEVLVIRPGDPNAVPVSLNPLEREPRFPLQTHIDLVRALFLAAFEAQEPFPQVLSYALTRCYEDQGWDLALGESKIAPLQPRYPSLSDLQRAALRVVENIGYGQEVTDNVRGFIDVRIGSLRLGTPGRFFEGGHPLDIAELLRRNVVLEIEDIGDDQDKAFFIGTVLIRLVEHLRMHPGKNEDAERLRHITVVEEAHRLLKKVEVGSPAAQAVALFSGLLAEIRAYGEGIIVAEQIPSKILPDVIKNTAFKVVHRLPAQDDRNSVGATINLSEVQSEYVVTLRPGAGAVFVDGMDRPVLVQMPSGEKRESAEGAKRDVPIERVRSHACGLICQTNYPCTLREMTEGAWLAEDARFTLWIEMLVVAHVTGMPSPRLDAAWLVELCRHERRTLECAIGQSVQTAIDTRYAEMVLDFRSVPKVIWDRASRFTPEKLATHVRDLALCMIDGQPEPCTPDDVGFQAGRYRWHDVQAMLEIALQQGDEEPHARSAEWEENRGLVLTGETVAEQLECLFRQPAFLRSREHIIHGLVSPSKIEDAVTRITGASEWRTRLEDALTFLDFGHHPWPLDYVMERTSGKPGEGA